MGLLALSAKVLVSEISNLLQNYWSNVQHHRPIKFNLSNFLQLILLQSQSSTLFLFFVTNLKSQVSSLKSHVSRRATSCRKISSCKRGLKKDFERIAVFDDLRRSKLKKTAFEILFNDKIRSINVGRYICKT